MRIHCPEIDALTRHVRAFAVTLTERQGERLPDWLVAVRQDDLPSLDTRAAGLDRDRDAVIAGLTLPWSSGAVEGHVNRIKMIKRQRKRWLQPPAQAGTACFLSALSVASATIPGRPREERHGHLGHRPLRQRHRRRLRG
ncbi:hypothetical protein [Streptomyces sp. NPDC099088]|uniref:hypothetical protein n=1 Tax=Streptomyces sp. NPDC099088 TaxID=3366101 RepID=UPI0037F13548